MLIDTHCHINIMVASARNIALTDNEILQAQSIIDQAAHYQVTSIITVGTDLIESKNCVELAKKYPPLFASVGLHPNDCTGSWRDDLAGITDLVRTKKENKIVAIGECGIDKHYPDFNLQRQKDVFKAQIELALAHDLALIVHTRDAPDETMHVLEEFKGQLTRGVIHCFSEDQTFADFVIEMGFVIGIGGIITYPKNNTIRALVQQVPLESIVLETDAPFLPPQIIRGKQNHPLHIATIAHYLAELRGITFDQVCKTTTRTAQHLFSLPKEPL